jgi:hypothetical protein
MVTLTLIQGVVNTLLTLTCDNHSDSCG